MFVFLKMELGAQIEALLEEKFASEADLADCFTVDVELKPGNRLSVYIDSDSGITFEKCRKVSRYLEAHIDAQGWLGEKYALEVSSPGVGRPLRYSRQFRNNIGRTIQVTMPDKSVVKGTLTEADDAQFTLTQNVTEREGKKKKRTQNQYDISVRRNRKSGGKSRSVTYINLNAHA